MVDLKTETKPQTNPRDAIREARQRRLRLVKGDANKTIKVFAANEDMRVVLRHANGTRFRDTLDQGVEWPNDSFTSRRIKDGSVRTDGPGSGEAVEPNDSLNPRQQAAARTAKSAKSESKPTPPKPQPSHPAA